MFFDSVSLLDQLIVHFRWLIYTYDLIKDCLNRKRNLISLFYMQMNITPYCRHLWYSQNILQWRKNDMKSMKRTSEDYSTIDINQSDTLLSESPFNLYLSYVGFLNERDEFQLEFGMLLPYCLATTASLFIGNCYLF